MREILVSKIQKLALLPFLQRRQYLDNYNIGNTDGILGKKIQPTFGVSFGLPQWGGGYPLNPFSANPFANPYGNVVGGGGINLGLISVNPLVSFQVTKNDHGEKVFKPLVNLHVTPNDFLVHKLSGFLHHKKQALHHHLHHHAYPPPPPHHYHRPPYYPHHHHHHGPPLPPPPPLYRPLSYPPSYAPPPPPPPGPIREPPVDHHGPPVNDIIEGPTFYEPIPDYQYGPPVYNKGPTIYRDRPAPSHHRLPHYFTESDFSDTSKPNSFFDDTLNNYGGGFTSGNFDHFRRTLPNNTFNTYPVTGHNVLDEYQKRYENQGFFFNQPDEPQSSRGGKSITFPANGRSDKTNLVTFEKVSKVRSQ